MEKEVSNGTFLGIVLIAIATIIALGFGVYGAAMQAAGHTEAVNFIDAFGRIMNRIVDSIAGICIVLAAWFCYCACRISYKDDKYKFMGDGGRDVRVYYEALGSSRSASIVKGLKGRDVKKYDLIQDRVEMNKTGIFKAMLCRVMDVSRRDTLVIDRTREIGIKGKVELAGKYFKVGDWYLLRRAKYLETGREVDMRIATAANEGYAIKRINRYDVVADNM